MGHADSSSVGLSRSIAKVDEQGTKPVSGRNLENGVFHFSTVFGFYILRSKFHTKSGGTKSWQIDSFNEPSDENQSGRWWKSPPFFHRWGGFFPYWAIREFLPREGRVHKDLIIGWTWQVFDINYERWKREPPATPLLDEGSNFLQVQKFFKVPLPDYGRGTFIFLTDWSPSGSRWEE